MRPLDPIPHADTCPLGPASAPLRDAQPPTRGGFERPQGAGLVLSATSHKERVVIDAVASRLRRMKRSVIGTAHAIQDVLQGRGVRYRAAMVTLTYAPGEVWEPRDVSRLTNHYRSWARSRGIMIHGVWVLETTKAGTPHYHLLLFIPRGYSPPLPDKQGWWSKGMTNAKWARKAVGYLAKYASKGASGLPSGARVHGYIGIGKAMGILRSWFVAPAWLREFSTYGDHLRRVDGWWRNCATGIEYRSPWVLDSFRAEGPELRWVGWSVDDVRFVGDA